MEVRGFKIVLVVFVALQALFYAIQNLANLDIAYGTVAYVMSNAEHMVYPTSAFPAITHPALIWVALGVILTLAYFTGDSLPVADPQGKILEGGEAGSSVNQWVSTGIWYSMFLGIIAGAFFVIDLLKGLIKS